jgi:hypothetical protein
LKDKTSRVVVAGSRIDVLVSVHHLQSLGVAGNRITVALTNSLPDIVSDENVLGKMSVEFARACTTALDKCTLASVETSIGCVVAVMLKSSACRICWTCRCKCTSCRKFRNSIK